jgi:hypothetical protein
MSGLYPKIEETLKTTASYIGRRHEIRILSVSRLLSHSMLKIGLGALKFSIAE